MFEGKNTKSMTVHCKKTRAGEMHRSRETQGKLNMRAAWKSFCTPVVSCILPVSHGLV